MQQTNTDTWGGKHCLISFCKGILAFLAILLAMALTLELLLGMAVHVGGPGAAQAGTVDAAIMDKYDMFMTNRISDALDGVVSLEKVYWISDDALVAPEPSQSCYGQADDPASLQWLVEEAAHLLDGQTLYFRTDTEIMPGSQVQYYLDETILAITWKEVHDHCVYTFSEVKIAHPSQFRRFLAGGEFGSDKQFITTEMAASVNAVVASSGDFYRFRNAGVVVYDGIVRRNNVGVADTCYIDRSGDLHFTYRYDYMTMEQAQQFVEEQDIRFSLVFGPVLVDDGVRCEPDKYLLGEINDEYARAALCQMDTLHYLLAAANAEGQYRYVPTIHRFARRIQETGCKMAYALDGGQTAVIAMNDTLINRVVYGYQRKISDIIYFATAVPYGG